MLFGLQCSQLLKHFKVDFFLQALYYFAQRQQWQFAYKYSFCSVLLPLLVLLQYLYC